MSETGVRRICPYRPQNMCPTSKVYATLAVLAISYHVNIFITRLEEPCVVHGQILQGLRKQLICVDCIAGGLRPGAAVCQIRWDVNACAYRDAKEGRVYETLSRFYFKC